MYRKRQFRAGALNGAESFISADRLSHVLEELRALLEYQHALVDLSSQRSLSFGDYIVDRWEKAKILGFGEGTSIYDSALVFGQVLVGNDTWIGPFSLLDGSGELTIGNNCTISAGVKIYTHDTEHWVVYGADVELEPACCSVTIHDNVYIGPNAVIKAGVSIGEGAIIEANCVVDKNIERGARYGFERFVNCQCARQTPQL